MQNKKMQASLPNRNQTKPNNSRTTNAGFDPQLQPAQPTENGLSSAILQELHERR